MLDLKALRLAKGLTQMQLAELSGVNQATISDIERQARPRPTFGTAVRIARALDVQPEELFAVEEQSA